jgi:hypothetical protein
MYRASLCLRDRLEYVPPEDGNRIHSPEICVFIKDIFQNFDSYVKVIAFSAQISPSEGKETCGEGD